MNRNTAKTIGRNLMGKDAWWQVNKKLAVDLGAEVAIAIADLINVEEMLEKDGNLPKDDWFFQSISDVEKHTGLNRHSQEKAYAKLRVKKFIEQVNKGQPRRRWFRIDWPVIIEYYAGDEEDDNTES